MIILSLLVIVGLGFAGYSAMNKGNKSANNTYSSDKTSASSTSKAPAKSASSTISTSATSKPEEKASGKSESSTAALKNQSQENQSKAKIATIKKNRHSSASASKVVATAKTPSNKSASTCSLTVRGPISKGNKVMLRGSRVKITRGETVASVLKKVAKEKHVSLAYQGGGGSTYIRGIGGLFEFDHGSGSGWLYSVNNKFPGYAAGKKKVKSGDNIQWLYTENLGKDRHSPVASQH
jgi:hypothetical protein